MNKEKVMEYVMETPGNTNPNVLRSLLDSSDDNRFIVTLTPTAQDFSGTMDKSPAEITDAYNAGQDIEFDIPSLSVKCKAMEFAVTDGIIMAGAIVTYRMGSTHLLIEILTNNITLGYETHLYSLTPASLE